MSKSVTGATRIIVNGDSAAEALTVAGLGALADGTAGPAKIASPEPRILVLRDVLSCGLDSRAPLSRNLRAWREAREAFWRRVWATAERWGWLDAPFEAVRRLPANVYAAAGELEQAEEIVVCVGAGLSDQLVLGFLDAWFGLLGLDRQRVKVAAFLEPRHPGDEPRPAGVAHLSPGDISALWAPKTADPATWSEARRLWQASRSARPMFVSEPDPGPNPEPETGPNPEPAPEPVSAGAAWNARFPAAPGGLAAWDRALLEASSGADPTLRDVLGGALRAEAVRLDPVGDLVLLHRVVTRSTDGAAPAWWTLGPPRGSATVCALTEYGAGLLTPGDQAVADPAANDWVHGLV